MIDAKFSDQSTFIWNIVLYDFYFLQESTEAGRWHSSRSGAFRPRLRFHLGMLCKTCRLSSNKKLEDYKELTEDHFFVLAFLFGLQVAV